MLTEIATPGELTARHNFSGQQEHWTLYCWIAKIIHCSKDNKFSRPAKSLPPTITEKWRKPTFCPLHFTEDCDVWLRERSWKKFKFTGIVPSTISADAAISELLL